MPSKQKKSIFTLPPCGEMFLSLFVMRRVKKVTFPPALCYEEIRISLCGPPQPISCIDTQSSFPSFILINRTGTNVEQWCHQKFNILQNQGGAGVCQR